MSPSSPGAAESSAGTTAALALEPPERLLARVADPALRRVAERSLAGERLSFEDGLVLFRSPDLLGVYSLHAALSEGSERALVADLVPAESRGRAFGWFHGLVGAAALPASAGFGLLWTWSGSRTAFLAGAGVALLAAGLLLVAVPQRTRPSVR